MPLGRLSFLLLALAPVAVQAQTDLKVRDAHLRFDGGAVLHLTAVPFSARTHRLERCGESDGSCVRLNRE